MRWDGGISSEQSQQIFGGVVTFVSLWDGCSVDWDVFS